MIGLDSIWQYYLSRDCAEDETRFQFLRQASSELKIFLPFAFCLEILNHYCSDGYLVVIYILLQKISFAKEESKLVRTNRIVAASQQHARKGGAGVSGSGTTVAAAMTQSAASTTKRGREDFADDESYLPAAKERAVVTGGISGAATGVWSGIRDKPKNWIQLHRRIVIGVVLDHRWIVLACVVLYGIVVYQPLYIFVMLLYQLTSLNFDTTLASQPNWIVCAS